MEAKIKAMKEEEETGADARSGSFSEMSQKELEDSMAKTRDELEAAKAQKDFAKCMELQVCLFRQMLCARRSYGCDTVDDSCYFNNPT